MIIKKKYVSEIFKNCANDDFDNDLNDDFDNIMTIYNIWWLANS